MKQQIKKWVGAGILLMMTSSALIAAETCGFLCLTTKLNQCISEVKLSGGGKFEYAQCIASSQIRRNRALMNKQISEAEFLLLSNMENRYL